MTPTLRCVRFLRLALALALAALAACRADTSVPPSGDPSASAQRAVVASPRLGVPLCRQPDITSTPDAWGAAAGSYGGSFRLAPTSAECVLPARPSARLLDAAGSPLAVIHDDIASTAFVPVRARTGKDATFVTLLWAGHGGEPSYRCLRENAAAAALELDTGTSRIVIEIPADRRPVLCADPPDQVFVAVLARTG